MAAKRVTPAMRQRRALAGDLLAAALLAAVVFSLAAGLGVVAVIALPVFVLGLAWVGVERLARRNSHPGFRKAAKDSPPRV
jgi:hypothetical protein